MDVEYVCPYDGKLFFKAEEEIGTAIETHCQTCKSRKRNPLVRPVARRSGAAVVFQRTSKCEECKRTLVTDCPVDEQRWCLACGHKTLWVVEEISGPPLGVGQGAEKAVEPTRAPR